MVSFEKFLNTFRNLKPDAIPRPPRPMNVNIEDAENSESSNAPEEIIIEPADSSGDEKKQENPTKKKFFSNKKKDKNGKEGSKSNKEKRNNKEPSSPINTQATGNVINIVQSKDIHWGNQITYNLGSNLQEQQTGSSNEYVKKTSDIKRLMEAIIKPEHEYIDYIAKNLGKNWRSFFKTLGYSNGRIETVEIDEARNGVSEARYKLLLDWVRNDDDGSLGHLSTLLWEDNEREIVKELAEIFKRNQ